MLQENETITQAQPVKYQDIEYCDNYVVITQNRTRRRVYNGFHFEDTGTHIYISTYYADIFQHKNKIRRFIVNTVTKEWRDYQAIVIEKHKPEIKDPKENNFIKELVK